MARVRGAMAQRRAVAQEAIARLDTSPGVGQRAAEMLSAALGIARSRFPSAKPLAAWAGLCRGTHESGGKRLSGKTRQGSRWLRQGRVDIAHVASKTPNTELAAPSKRSAARRGKQRALMAVGQPLLTLVSMMLTRKQPYQELGGAYFVQREQHRVERRLGQRVER